jgi:hypothetical protein
LNMTGIPGVPRRSKRSGRIWRLVLRYEAIDT